MTNSSCLTKNKYMAYSSSSELTAKKYITKIMTHAMNDGNIDNFTTSKFLIQSNNTNGEKAFNTATNLSISI